MSSRLYGGAYDGAELAIAGAPTIWVREDPDRRGQHALLASRYHRAGAVSYRFVGTAGEICVYCFSRIANRDVLLAP